MPRDLDTLSRHPLKRYAWCFLPLRFPPRPQASGKIHSISDPRFAVRQPLKTPPILVSHQLGEPIGDLATPLPLPPVNGGPTPIFLGGAHQQASPPGESSLLPQPSPGQHIALVRTKSGARCNAR